MRSGGAGASGGSDNGAANALLLPAGVQQPRAWKLAVPPAGKKPPGWEASWQRFQKGDSIERIALTQESGKTIQPNTVHGHLLTALVQGLMHDRVLNPDDVMEYTAVETTLNKMDDDEFKKTVMNLLPPHELDALTRERATRESMTEMTITHFLHSFSSQF